VRLPARSSPSGLLWVLAAGALACAVHPEAHWPDPGDLTPPPSTSASPGASRPFVAVEHPADEAVHGDVPAYLAGQARAPVGAPHHDVVLVLDVSGSTVRDAAAPDADLPSPSLGADDPAPPGSILAVALEAARAFLEPVDFRATRVALVTFAGTPSALPRGQRGRPSWALPPARAVASLGRDPAALEESFDEILQGGSGGMTHMSAGLRQAVAELVGGPGASSRSDPSSAKVIVFLTDGHPTLPYGTRRANERAVLEEVDRAAAYGIQIFSYGIGGEALEGPLALVEMARRTGGAFVPVRNPSTLPHILPRLRFGALESLRVHNRTTGEPALASLLRPDGSFDALVRLAPGRNEVEVVVEATDGGTGRAIVPLVRWADAASPAPPPRLEARRAEIGEELEIQRTELWGEILRERAAAEGRAAERRRELELEPAAPGTQPLSPPAAP